MKVLSLTQPWASLVACEAKRIETRSWSTKYRGPIAIHAAKGFPPDAAVLCNEEPFKAALAAAGYRASCQLPRGAIISVCHVIGVVPTERVCAGPQHAFHKGDDRIPATLWIPYKERCFGNYDPERFAWVLDRVYKLPEPIPAKGRLGLWEFSHPLLDELQAFGGAQDG